MTIFILIAFVLYYFLAFLCVGLAHMMHPDLRTYFVAGSMFTQNKYANIAIAVSLPVWLPVTVVILLCVYGVAAGEQNEPK